MGKLLETLRGVRVLAAFYGGMALLARRAAAARTRAEARGLLLAHAARARQRAGIGLEIEGVERLPRAAAFVLVYNEGSVVQDLGTLTVLDRCGVDHAVVAAEFGGIPFFARAASRWGVVLLRRGRRAEVDRTLAALVAALRAGERVSMGPQGRFAPDGRICHFKRGAFLVAIRAGAPIVPVGVAGGGDILPPRSLRIRPGILRFRIGEPISTAGRREEDAPALAEIAHAEVARLIGPP